MHSTTGWHVWNVSDVAWHISGIIDWKATDASKKYHYSWTRILVDFVPLSDPIAFRVAQNTALLSDERINLASALSFWAGGVWVGPNILKYYVRADILKIISFPNHPTIKYPHSVFNISTLLSIKIQKILNQFSPNP